MKVLRSEELYKGWINKITGEKMEDVEFIVIMMATWKK